jgi:hypothetical protein
MGRHLFAVSDQPQEFGIQAITSPDDINPNGLFQAAACLTQQVVA